MRKILQRPIRFGFLLTAILLINSYASATSFTAVASGNWSNTLTWGGVVPILTNTLDQIIIPLGINVVMDNNVSINGVTAQITVIGTLSSSSGNVLNLVAGSVTGTGTINADILTLGAGAALLFTGSLTANTITSSANSLQTSASILVNQTLTLAAGILSIQTGGSLTMAGNSTVIVNGGQLAVNGGVLGLNSNYHVTYNSGTTVSGLELAGTGLQNVNVDVGALNSLTLSNDLTVDGTLRLTSGTLILGAHDLNILGDVAAAGTGTISSTIASDISIISANTIAGTLMFTGTASGAHDFILNVGTTNQATIAGALNISGTLTLTSGVLNLNSTKLRLTGSLATFGAGTISSSATSSVTVNTLSSPMGSLRFSAGNNTVDTFAVNIGGGGTVVVASNLNVNGRLNLISGHIDIGNNMLSMGALGTITGANGNAYVITGVTGSLAIPISPVSILPVEFPVGTATGYFPATVLLNTGSPAGKVQIGVSPNVLLEGTMGADISISRPLVDATWNVQSDIVSNLNMNMQLMWATGSEVNGFVRSSSFISHYTAGNWDASAAIAATAVTGGMFSSARTNITSLSPFSVFDLNTITGVTEISGTTMIEVYPNPASEFINVNIPVASGESVTVDIYNSFGQKMSGHTLNNSSASIPVNLLANGTYYLILHNDKMNISQKFIKL